MGRMNNGTEPAEPDVMPNQGGDLNEGQNSTLIYNIYLFQSVD